MASSCERSKMMKTERPLTPVEQDWSILGVLVHFFGIKVLQLVFDLRISYCFQNAPASCDRSLNDTDLLFRSKCRRNIKIPYHKKQCTATTNCERILQKIQKGMPISS